LSSIIAIFSIGLSACGIYPSKIKCEEATVGEVGKEVAEIFSKILLYLQRLSRARCEGQQQMIVPNRNMFISIWCWAEQSCP